jgi:uncharacterized protein (TIGR01244 family)
MKQQCNLFLILVSLLLLPVASLAETAGAEIQKIDVPSIVNFSRIDESRGFAGAPVGFGGATEPSAMKQLASMGFASVISLRLGDEEGMDVDASRQAAQSAGIRYLHLPFDPENLAPGEIQRVLDAAADPVNHPVYFHCSSATRVGAVWMIGRVLRDGWEIDAAQAEARQIAKKPDEAIAFANVYLASQ